MNDSTEAADEERAEEGAIDLRAANPYPGLRPFEASESNLYFGRDEQIDALLDRLEKTRFLAVVGTSGCGKSSLVRAGLIPSLMAGSLAESAGDWRIAITKPRDNPIGNLAASLAASPGKPPPSADECAALEATLGESSMGLVAAAQQIFGEQPHKLLVVIDQFEEIFDFASSSKRANAGDEAKAFVKLLLSAAEQDRVLIFVVLTMRSEFLGKCAQFRDLPEALNDSQFLVPRLTRAQMQEAIEGPAGVRRVVVTPRLVQRLLNEVGDDPEMLPVLQHALSRIWDARCDAHDRGLSLDIIHYEDVGGTLRGALDGHLELIYGELGGEEPEVARRMFRQLVKRSEGQLVRRRVGLTALIAAADAPVETVQSVNAKFSKRGRTFLVDDGGLIDISHESLFRYWDRFKEWIKREEESAEIYKRLADAAARRFSPLGLYGGRELGEALRWFRAEKRTPQWAERYDANFSRAISYLHWSRARRIVLWAVPSAFILYFGLPPVYRVINETREAARIISSVSDKSTEVFQAEDPADKLVAAVKGTVQVYAVGEDRLAKANNIKDAPRFAVNARTIKDRAHEFIDQLPERSVRTAGFSADGACMAVWGYPSAASDTVRQRRGRVTLAEIGASASGVVATYRVPPIAVEKSLLIAPRGDRVGVVYAGDILDVLTAPGCPPSYSKGTPATPSAQASQSMPRTMPGLLAVALSSNRIATGAWDGTVNVWDATSQELVGRLAAPETGGSPGPIWDLAFGDGLLAVSRGEGSVELWDVDTRRLVRTLSGHTGRVRRVAFHPSGRLLATAGADAIVALWNVDTGARERTFTGHVGLVNSVAFDRDGDRLVSAGADGSVRVWDAATGGLEFALRAHRSAAQDARFSPDGTQLVSASTDRTARVWDVRTRSLRMTLGDAGDGHARTVWSAEFNRDGTRIVTASEDGQAKVWDAADGHHLQTIRAEGDALNRAVFDAVGDRIVTVGNDDVVRSWEWATATETFKIPGHAGSIVDAVILAATEGTPSSADEPRVLVLGRGGEVRDLTSGAALEGLSHPGATRLRASGDGSRLVTFGRGSLKVWARSRSRETDATERTESWREVETPKLTDVVVNAALNRDGSRLATVFENEQPRVWELDGRTPVPQLRKTSVASGGDVALSRLGDVVAVVDKQGDLWAWNVVTGLPLLVADGEYRWVTFAPDKDAAPTRAQRATTASTPGRSSGGNSIVALAEDGSRLRLPLRDFDDSDATRLVGRAFTLMSGDAPSPYTAAAAIGAALAGDITRADYISRLLTLRYPAERQKAELIHLQDKLATRSFGVADLLAYPYPEE